MAIDVKHCPGLLFASPGLPGRGGNLCLGKKGITRAPVRLANGNNPPLPPVGLKLQKDGKPSLGILCSGDSDIRMDASLSLCGGPAVYPLTVLQKLTRDLSKGWRDGLSGL